MAVSVSLSDFTFSDSIKEIEGEGLFGVSAFGTLCWKELHCVCIGKSHQCRVTDIPWTNCKTVLEKFVCFRTGSC